MAAGRIVDSRLSCPVFVAHELTASVVGSEGMWSGRLCRAVHLSTGRSAVASKRFTRPPFWGLDGPAFGAVAGQAPGAVEDGEGAVGVFVNSHPGADEVGAGRVLGQPQDMAVVAHGVVVADDALLLAAQDVLDLGQAGRHEGTLGQLRGLGDARGVVGQIDFLDEAVGRRRAGDAGQLVLLDQAILQGAEGALRAAPGLRRIGREVLDPLITVELVTLLARRNSGAYRCCTRFVNLGATYSARIIC